MDWEGEAPAGPIRVANGFMYQLSGSFALPEHGEHVKTVIHIYFGEIMQTIRRPCWLGPVSTFPTSASCSMTPSITRRPSST